MKKLLLLGGSRYLIPVIEAAHNLGIYTITCDYLPDNIAHKCSDEYYDVSIIEKDAVLELAQKLNIDGIMSFACDPGVVTAAYVAEKLGLPSCGSYESVSILQNKGKFRAFLSEHNFNVPTAKAYSSVEDALSDVSLFHWPVIVKPVDSAGSKGVTKVEDPSQLEKSISYALGFSRCREFIIEDFIVQKGFSSDSDCFSVNGEFKAVTFNSQRFDVGADNPYAPSAYTWPSSIPESNQNELRRELQRLITLLDMKTSIYNIETRENMDGKAYIMEVSPRGGGNRLSECLKYITGIDFITNAVKAAIGEPVDDMSEVNYVRNWAEVILHGNEEGTFKALWVSEDISGNVVEKDLWVSEGMQINEFHSASEAVGTLILSFESVEKREEVMQNIDKFIRVIVD